MLLNLHVKNLALIQEAEVDFEPGLNILTGETGAGKSIIIGSMNLALGGKVSKDLVRKGTDHALVELVFEIENEEQREALNEAGIDSKEDMVIIQRRIRNGRSINKINGESVTNAMLHQVASIFIDIHGQHENQSLMNRGNQLQVLDDFGKDEIFSQKKVVSEKYHAYEGLHRKLEQTAMGEEERLRRISFLTYEVEEISKAELNEGEDERLEQRFKKMENAQNILSSLQSAVCYLKNNGEQNASDLLSAASRELYSISDCDGGAEELCESMSRMEEELSDLVYRCKEYADSFDFSQEEYRETEERLNLINSLKRKYGTTIPDILNYREEQMKELEQLSHSEEYRNQLQKRADQTLKEYYAAAEELTRLRKKAAKVLEQKIFDALSDLNFLNVDFGMEFLPKEKPSAQGMEDVEFMISTNPGERRRPLGAVASGGELSRIVLAIKTVLARNDRIDTLIFDEIDTGISGRTAQKVSEKMAELAKERQVICITHLPQIAAMADQHFLIEKECREEETCTKIHELKREEEVEELARILGGAHITDTVRKSAREMKRFAMQYKKAV